MEKKLILPDPEPETVLKLLPGDKDGNWLWKREIGEVFLCRDKPMMHPSGKIIRDSGLNQLEVVTKIERSKSVQIASTLNEPMFLKWVDSEQFSKDFELVVTLGKVENG